MAGYVKIYRSVLRHWVFTHDGMFYLWCNLLLRANWKEGKFRPRGAHSPITIARGQLVTGRDSLHAMLYPLRDENGRKIARETAPPHKTTLWRWLKALEKDGMVRLDVRSSFTVVTICNYDLYQRRDGDDAPDDDTDVRQPCADDAPLVRQTCAARAPLVRTIEEELKKDKKGKKGKKKEESKEAAAQPLPELLQTPDFEAAWASWVQYRKERKQPLTPTGAVAQLKALAALGHDRAIAAVRHSIAQGWQGIYEPRQNGVGADRDPRGNLALRERMLLKLEAEDGSED